MTKEELLAEKKYEQRMNRIIATKFRDALKESDVLVKQEEYIDVVGALTVFKVFCKTWDLDFKEEVDGILDGLKGR